MSGVATLRAFLGGEEQGVARLAAALWARVGRPLRGIEELDWARGLAGDSGPEAVWNALLEVGAVDTQTGHLRGAGVVRLTATLVGAPLTGSMTVPGRSLVWTLPSAHPAATVRGASYSAAIDEMIRLAEKSLLMVTPFLDTRGIAALAPPLVVALRRGVTVTILTHDALQLGSRTSSALDDLRREAERAGGALTVYSAPASCGPERVGHPLLHAKVVVRDAVAGLVGSANLTAWGLGSNLEVGAYVGSTEAAEILVIIDGVLMSGLAYLAYSTGAHPVRADGARS